MFLRFLSFLAIVAFAGAASARDIRVCADPDNLPISNNKGEGYENRITELVASSIAAHVTYVWWNDRRSTALEALAKTKCDLVPGVLAGVPGVAATRPYMRSSYAFVTRAGEQAVDSFSAPRLKQLKIGVQSVGDDGVTPPVMALLHEGLAGNIRAYTLHGNYSDPNSAGGIVAAVADRDIDAAVLWGPFAGYFAARQAHPLTVKTVSVRARDPQMNFAIAMATRADDKPLRDEIDKALDQRKSEIARILAEFHVPLLPMAESEAAQ